MLTRSKTRTKAYKRLQPKGKSNRSLERSAWQREMIEAHAHIRACERCGATWPLTHAHRLKKRFITTREEWLTVAKLCVSCHTWAEYGTKDEPGTHERMFKTITELIENR